MANAELIKCVENPLVRVFLEEHLDEFVSDVRFFSGQIFAHVSPEDKSFVRSAGLAFYSTPIVDFVRDLPWQTMKTAIANAVTEAFQMKIDDEGHPEKRLSGVFKGNHTEAEFIKETIVKAFASTCKTSEVAMGAILIGGLAHLLGKYIALYTAGIIDEVIELKSWPIAQVPCADVAQIQSMD